MSAGALAIRGVRAPCQCRVRQQQLRPAEAFRSRLPALIRPSASRGGRNTAPWRNDEALVQIATASTEPEESSWSSRSDTTDIARQQGVTRSKWKQLLHSPYDTDIFAVLVPALLAILLDPVMVLIDTAIVGRLGTLPLAAVGLSNLLFFFCTVFFSFLLVATTPKVANAVAKNELQQASEFTAHALIVAAVCGVLLGIALWLAAPNLISVLKPDNLVYGLTVRHLRMRALACPATVLMFVAVGAFRGFKDTTTPLIASAAQNLVNLSLDLFFVFVAGWGVVGSASAATIGQYVGLATILVMLGQKGMLRMSDLRSWPRREELVPMTQAGFGLAFCIGAVMCSVMGATTMATGLGAVTLAAHTVVKNIVDYANGIFGTFSTTAQSLVASELGKGNAADAQGFLVRLLQIGFAAGSVVALGILLLQGRLIALFTSDAQVIMQATSVLPLIALVMPLAPFASALEGTLLGALDIPHVAIRTILSATISCTFLVWANSQNLGLTGVWIGLVLVVSCNMLTDAWKVTSAWSPFKKIAQQHDSTKEP